MIKVIIKRLTIFKIFLILILFHFNDVFSQEPGSLHKNMDHIDSLEKNLKELEKTLKELRKTHPDVEFDSTRHWLLWSLESEIKLNISKRMLKKFYIVRLWITFNREGLITRTKLIQSSGSKRIDNKILRIIKNAKPFGKLPQDYESDTLKIDLRLKGDKELKFFNN